jgi:uncharacterized protein YuzE
MKLHQYSETDSLYVELMSTPGVDSREIMPGLVADFDSCGGVVGFDIDIATLRAIAEKRVSS